MWRVLGSPQVQSEYILTNPQAQTQWIDGEECEERLQILVEWEDADRLNADKHVQQLIHAFLTEVVSSPDEMGQTYPQHRSCLCGKHWARWVKKPIYAVL